MPTQTNQELSNDLISVKVKHLPGCQVVLETTLTPKGTEEAWKIALKKINKEISIPGFRKGKAPNDRIEKEYLTYIQKEWNEEIIQIAFQNGLTLSRIYPMNRDWIKKPKVKNAERGVGAEITFEFTTTPDVPRIDPKALQLKSVPPKLMGETEVNDTIEALRYNKATWNKLDKPKIEEGDFVRLDIINLDLPTRPSICENTPFEMKEGKMGRWLYQALMGKAVEDVVHALSEKEEESDTPFTPTNCQITIKSCEKPELPELDDAFAAQFGCKDVEDLKKRVQDDLNRQAKDEAFEEEKKQVVMALCNTYPFDIPEPLFQEEKKGRLKEIEEDLKRRTLEEKEHFEKSFSDDAFSEGVRNSLRMLFFVRRLADQFHIRVSEQEWMEELSYLYSKRDPIVQHWMTNYNREEMQNELNSRILRRKVLEEVVKQAFAPN